MKKKRIKNIALASSIVLIMVWALLGTVSTVAWFHEEDEIVNSIHFGELEIELYHKVDGNYEKVDSYTKIFDDEALYEPGYTQTVFLKVVNVGTVPFQYRLSVLPDKVTEAENVYGELFELPEYLRFGVVVRDSEEALLKEMESRDVARENAILPLETYKEDRAELDVGCEQYIAIVIYMPEDVGNEANYRGEKQPEVTLAIEALAMQLGMPEE